MCRRTYACAVSPTQENVAGLLQQALALDHSLGAVGVVALAQVGLEHRLPRFFDLQEQQVLLVAAGQQNDPRARTRTPYAHDLAGHVQVFVAVQEAAVRAQACSREPVAGPGARAL